MNRRVTAMLAGSMLVGCTTNSGVTTTPTFAAARYLPPSPGASQERPPRTSAAPSPATAPRPVAASTVHRGAKAVSAANLGATIEPDSRSMRGASWYIDDADQTRIYRIATAPGRVTTILLPPGERFNGAVGGDVEGFLINVTYAGPRPAVSILPRSGQGRGNLQLVTTGGFYSFELQVNRSTALNLVDIGDQPATSARPAAGLPQPEGDFTRLALLPVAEAPLPAWAPTEAWADSFKMVVRFDAPLPVLPALLAGQRGEQLITYRSEAVGPYVLLLTSRRVTEAELRLDSERIRITIDPAAMTAGTAAGPGATGWRPAATLPDAVPTTPLPAQPSLSVLVLPPANPMPVAGAAATPAGQEPAPLPVDRAPAPAAEWL